MPQTTLMPVQREFSTPIRSGVCHVYLRFVSVFGVRFGFCVLYITVMWLFSQMCWSGTLCSLVSLPLSIFPTVENTG